MADDRKHIDELFKDYLTGYSAKAPDGAWQRLQSEMHPAQKRRSFLYLRLAAAAVLLLIAFASGYFWSEFNKQEDKTLISEIPTRPSQNVDNDEINHNIQALPLENQKALDAEKPVLALSNADPSGNQSSEIAKTPVNVAFEDHKMISEPQPLAFSENNNEVNESENSERLVAIETIDKSNVSAQESLPPSTTAQPEKMTPEMLHQMLVGNDEALAEEIIQKSKTRQPQQWSVGGQFSPVYSYRTLDGTGFSTPDDQVDKSYYNNTENGLMAYAGGISLNYGFNDRLSLASGLYLSRIGQENTDVVAYDSPDSPYLYNLASSGGTVTINPQKFDKVMVREVDITKDSVPGDYIVNGTFIQNLDYLEVPLVIKYKMLQSRLSVNLSGGLSPGILVNNRSYFSVDGEKVQTGFTENIKPMIYNSVMGVGVEYSISTKLSLNLDPLFKYSLSPINSNSGLKYHPYSISFFTGVTYKL